MRPPSNRVTVKSGQGAVSGITGWLIDNFFLRMSYVEIEWSVLDFPEVMGSILLSMANKCLVFRLKSYLIIAILLMLQTQCDLIMFMQFAE